MTAQAPAEISTAIQTGDRRFAIFAALTAVSLLVWHADIAGERFGFDWQTLAFLAALAVLVRPLLSYAFLALAVIETVAVWHALPMTNTNRLLQLFVSGTLAMTGIYVVAASGFRRLDRMQWLARFQPLLRLELIIVYLLAGWHKLNTGFFNLQDSCAVHMYLKIGLPAPGDLARWLLIFATIATELCLPVLLTLRRTRNFAVGYGIAFHAFLGITGFYSFSTTMITLLFLFAPDGFIEAATEFWREHKRATLAAGALAALLFLAGIALMHTRAGNFLSVTPIWEETLHANHWMAAMYWVFFVFGPLSAGFYLWLWWRRGATFIPDAHCCGPISPIFWIVPALLVFDGLTPYLGLKTETAFAMYSNLRTEGGPTNHLIWRNRLDLGGYQENLVRVVSSSDPALEADARDGLDIPFFVMRTRIADLARKGAKDVAITYVQDGVTRNVDHAESAPDLASPPSWLERKLLKFRRIQLTGCPH